MAPYLKRLYIDLLANGATIMYTEGTIEQRSHRLKIEGPEPEYQYLILYTRDDQEYENVAHSMYILLPVKI